jgi:DMSO reductase anchor subunit
MALGLASGWLLFASLIAIWPPIIPVIEPSLLAGFGFILLFACLNIKLWIWRRNQGLKPISNLNSATGIKNPKLRQTSMGLMGGSFNTREFFHQQSNLVIGNLRKIIFFNVYFLPMIVLAYAISTQSYGWIVAAFVIHCSGLIAERWMFFAEANHPQNLYYQRVS